MKKNNELNKYYKDFFIEHSIRYIDDINDFNNINGKILFVTSCSKTKTEKEKAIPKEFYVSKRNIKFYDMCEKLNLLYAIQSDKYGLLFSNEEVEYYDIHPSKLTIEDKKLLGEIIKNKAKKNNIDNIIFCNSSPLQSRPYLEMLYFSNISYYFISDLKLIEQYYKNK